MEPGKGRTTIRARIEAIMAGRGHELGGVLSIWFVLAVVMLLLAKENLSVPGLYYDEAVFAGMAKDFLTGQVHGQHMPGHVVTWIFGRPFPVFIQLYLGALKSWMLMPGLGLFGSSVVVLRATNLLWGLVALLFFMLGAWRWLGLRIALFGGSLLALDPTYFFLCLWDWGSAVPSFFCRCLCFYLIVVWWRRRQARYVFLAGFFAGLGFFNKIDFAVLIVAVAIAGLVCFRRQLQGTWRTGMSAAALSTAGFLLGAAPMLWKMPMLVGGNYSGLNSSPLGEFPEKFSTMWALYDGSYFYRLMSAGGIFEKMFSERLGFQPVLGAAVVAAVIALLAIRLRNRSDTTNARVGIFFVLAAVLVTLGVILLPGAVRIHHAVLVYPLPQLIIATAAHVGLETFSRARWRRTIQATIWIALLGLFLSQLWAIQNTRELVRETGGRGHWSESLDAFCRENKDRNDLTILSLDWGFNEQLNFLTNGPRLEEPFWEFGENTPSLSADPHNLYLVHAPEYNFFVYGRHYLEAAKQLGTAVEVRPYFDRQNRIVFYTIQFPRN
jgi:Dolichyl-phosphate-mannose-protein mannosyltransferase